MDDLFSHLIPPVIPVLTALTACWFESAWELQSGMHRASKKQQYIHTRPLPEHHFCRGLKQTWFWFNRVPSQTNQKEKTRGIIPKAVTDAIIVADYSVIQTWPEITLHPRRSPQISYLSKSTEAGETNILDCYFCHVYFKWIID